MAARPRRTCASRGGWRAGNGNREIRGFAVDAGAPVTGAGGCPLNVDGDGLLDLPITEDNPEVAGDSFDAG
jgi:hypothetical protein